MWCEIAICVSGEFVKLSVGIAEEKRGGVASYVATALQSFPCQGNITPVEALMDSGNLIPHYSGAIRTQITASDGVSRIPMFQPRI